MLIRNDDKDWNHRKGSEITPAALYHARRDWMRQVAAGAGADGHRPAGQAAGLTGCR